MISDWLKATERKPSPSSRFRVFDIMEQKAKTEDVKKILGSTFLKHTVNISLIQKAAKNLGWEKAYKYFGQPAQPTTFNMKKGRFGEIILAIILEELFDYVIPIHKLKYAFTSDQSLPTTDLLAIKKNGDDILEMCFIESKVRTTKDTSALSLAYNQLMEDQTNDLPDILRFIMNHLDKQGNPLVDSFLVYCSDINSSTKDTFRIGAVFDKNMWNEKSLHNLHGEITDPPKRITVDIVLIDNLEDFIKDFYQSLGVNLIAG